MKNNKSRAMTKPEHRREEKICIKQPRGPASKFKTFQKKWFAYIYILASQILKLTLLVKISCKFTD